MAPFVLGTLIFIGTIGLIASDRIDKTVVALTGAVAIIFANILSDEEAFEAVDWNVIFLLMGMMIIVGVMRETGVFQWLAIRSAKLARGEPFPLLVVLSLVTAVLSAFLDNVTTVVLVTPVTLLVVNALQLNPVPFLISEALASNVGGAATLIGHPPNIMIGSAGKLDFVAFIVNVAPVAIVVMVLFIATAWLLFGREMKITPENKARVMEMDETETITDAALLGKAAIVMGAVVVGFSLHGVLGREVAVFAMAGAMALVFWGRQQLHEVLLTVEWSSLLFFVGLFIVVAGVTRVGLIDLLVQGVLGLTQGSLVLTTLAILWVSTILSSLVNQVAYTAAMIPLVHGLGASMSIGPLWWSLSLGACLGSNLTAIGTAANVLVVNMAGRAGYPISFWLFSKYGAIIVAESVLVSTLYLYLRYLS